MLIASGDTDTCCLNRTLATTGVSTAVYARCVCRIASDVCSGLVTKCLSASRAKTKEKAVEVFMLVIEAEKQEFAQVMFDQAAGVSM